MTEMLFVVGVPFAVTDMKDLGFFNKGLGFLSYVTEFFKNLLVKAF
jgi:hypothetical protein